MWQAPLAFLKVWLGEPVAGWLKTLSASAFYKTWLVPFVIGVTPFLFATIALAYVLSREETEPTPTAPTKEPTPTVPPKSPEPMNNHQNEISTLPPEKLLLLKDLGIVNVTPDLKDSEFHPHQCMSHTRKHLMFMGILGSKWVFDSGFENFARRIQHTNGSLRFLLIHPEGRAFATLTDLRQGNISTKSLDAFLDLKKKYPSLRVKLYEDLPVFRLIFVDGQTLALSRYKLDHEGYFDSKQGWDAPHLVIASSSRWSLYETFEDYFNNIWNRSTDIEDFLAAKVVHTPIVTTNHSKKG